MRSARILCNAEICETKPSSCKSVSCEKRTAGSDTQGEDAWWTSKEQNAGSVNKRVRRDQSLRGIFDRDTDCRSRMRTAQQQNWAKMSRLAASGLLIRCGAAVATARAPGVACMMHDCKRAQRASASQHYQQSETGKTHVRKPSYVKKEDARGEGKIHRKWLN